MSAPMYGFKKFAFGRAAINYHADCGVAEIMTDTRMGTLLWRLSVCPRLRRLGVTIDDEPLFVEGVNVWTAS